ncbi:putative nucleotide-diphospho-sugar transferase [Azospirillum sp. sgz301742]
MLTSTLRYEIMLGAAAERRPRRPLIIVFANYSYRDVLRNWIYHARAVGVANFLIVAMDEALMHDLRGAGVQVAHCSYDGTYGSLIVQRVRVLQFLAESGIDFIHSDVDAVWLEYGIDEYFTFDDFDLVFSQGTIWPPDVQADWGFVLCCGLFGARAGVATADFFARVGVGAARENSDQAVVNRILREAGVRWDKDYASSYTLNYGGREFTGYRNTIQGHCAGLNLRLALLPHHAFQRLPMAGEKALVSHPLSPKDAEGKRTTMRQHGMWALDP